MENEQFENLIGLAMFMGYRVKSVWNIRWRIVYPSGRLGEPNFRTEREAWEQVLALEEMLDGHIS